MIKILTKKQYIEMENTIEKCIETNQRLNRELNNSEGKLQRSLAKNKQLQQDLKEMFDDCIKYENTIEINNEKLIAQEKEIEKQRDTNKKLRLENQTLITDLENVRKELEETKKELEQKNNKKNKKVVKKLLDETIANDISKSMEAIEKNEEVEKLPKDVKFVAEVANKPKVKKTSRKAKSDK